MFTLYIRSHFLISGNSGEEGQNAANSKIKVVERSVFDKNFWA